MKNIPALGMTGLVTLLLLLLLILGEELCWAIFLSSFNSVFSIFLSSLSIPPLTVTFLSLLLILLIFLSFMPPLTCTFLSLLVITLLSPLVPIFLSSLSIPFPVCDIFLSVDIILILLSSVVILGLFPPLFIFLSLLDILVFPLSLLMSSFFFSLLDSSQHVEHTWSINK